MESCPFCQACVEYRCRCMRGDRKCRNGHEWHRCLEHPARIVEGPGDHAKSGCSCRPGKTFAYGLVPVPVEV